MNNLDKENLVRILKGQDKIQSLQCRIGWHRWTSWEHVEPGYTGFEYAKCYCADCGLPRVEKPYSKSRKKDQ